MPKVKKKVLDADLFEALSKMDGSKGDVAKALGKKELTKERVKVGIDILTRKIFKKLDFTLEQVNGVNITRLERIWQGVYSGLEQLHKLLARIEGTSAETDIVKIEQTFTNVNKLIAKIEEMKAKPQAETEKEYAIGLEGTVDNPKWVKRELEPQVVEFKPEPLPNPRMAQFKAETGQGEEIMTKEVMQDIQEEKIEPEQG